MESKKRKTLLIIAICTFAILVIGSTYAYFQNQFGNASSADVNVLTYTTDVLTFETGDPINIYADASNFKKGESSKTASTFARATLQANNKTNEATANYDILLDVSNNTLGYTKEGSAELIISIVDKNTGNEVTSIDGLTYVTVTDGNGNTIKGFDITTLNNKITLISNKEINAAPKTVEEYTITVTLVNYDYDQSGNSGKNFSAKLVIQKNGETSSAFCDSGENFSACLSDYSDNNVVDLTALYHHTSSLENGASDKSYRYAGNAKRPAYYKCEYDGQEVVTINQAGYIYKSTEEDCKNVYLLGGVYSDASMLGETKNINWDSTNNKCVTVDGDSVYSSISGNVSESDCTGTATGYANKNGNISYYFTDIKRVGSGTITQKYSDATGDVNNYVCMDKDAKECSEDDLFRIIGIFDGRIKLVRANFLSEEMAWDTNGSNTWSTSTLNKYLNGEYLESVSKFSDMIDTTTWKVGGNTYNNIVDVTPSVAYQNEIINPISDVEFDAKIGLMYISDYFFAALPYKWKDASNLHASGNFSKHDNWLFDSYSELLLTRNAETNNQIFYVDWDASFNKVNVDVEFHIRPTFYLKNTVKYLSGTGTLEDPMRFN